MTNLTGKRVLITGGAGGVGRTVAAQMVAAGERVPIANREGADFESALSGVGPGEIDTVAAHLSSSAGIATMFARADEWLDGLEILVACAGVDRAR